MSPTLGLIQSGRRISLSYYLHSIVLDIQVAYLCYFSYYFNSSLLKFLKGLHGEILPVLHGLFILLCAVVHAVFDIFK